MKPHQIEERGIMKNIKQENKLEDIFKEVAIIEEPTIEEITTEEITTEKTKAEDSYREETKLEQQKLLPLGSIIILEGGVKKIMIIARGIATKIGETVKYFDYGACLYPEGVIGDQLLYCNHIDINKIIATGFQDEEDKIVLENLEKWKKKTTY